jgi:hypothetical protein
LSFILLGRLFQVDYLQQSVQTTDFHKLG